ncbi:MAG: hypothetical protein SNJ74_09865 [Fimbriimonadaceae bacterium]
MKRSPDRLVLAVLALGAAASALIVLLGTSRYGIGLFPDTAVYFAGARSLASGLGFASFDGSPVVVFPPLYSILLAPFAGSPASGAIVLNIFLMALAGALSFGLAHRYTASLPAAAAIMLLVLLLRPMGDIASVALSELPFVVVVLVWIWLATRYLDAPNGRTLVLLAGVTALAVLLRYIGVFLVLLGVALAMLPPKPVRTRAAHAAAFAVLSALPIAAYLARNLAVSGTLAGRREPSQTGLLENLSLTLDAVLGWFWPQIALDVAPVYWGFAASIAVGLVWLATRTKTSNRDLLVPVAVVAAYLGLLVYTSTTAAFDPIGPRLAAPAYAPFVLIAGALVWRAWPNLGRGGRGILAVGLAVWLLPALADSGKEILERMRQGAGGYASSSWQENGAIRWIRESRPDSLVSNAADAVYLLTDISAESVPSRGTPKADHWPGGRTRTLVLFDDVERPYQLSLDELRSKADVQLVKTYPGAQVFRVSPR